MEKGLIPEARSASNNKACKSKQIAQCAKIILYLLFVGLAGYAMWQTFSINMMEFKVINSIRESEGLFGQRSTSDKGARNTAEQFHRFEDISTTKTSDLDSKSLSFTNETEDNESLNARDVITEEGVVGTTASIDEADGITFTTTTTTTESSVESNSSLEQQMNERFSYDMYDDYLVSDEMKLEREQEEILENYALLSLIIRNAVRSSHLVDSFVYYDSSEVGVSAALNQQNGNDVEEKSQGTQETRETQKTPTLFTNESDYEEGNSENSDYQTETVTESSARDRYEQFDR